ncbi:pectin lyase fold/virulence factor [Xylaria cf. heliscus]|nr:pectin lyase fold/virulence factor [Xylaria cf. heliscus]
MYFTQLLSVLPLIGCASAASVVGTAYGFAKGVTPTGTTVTPTNNAQLSSFLADSTPRVIVLTKTFDFATTTTTGTACRATDKCSGGQDTIKDSCDPNETRITATYNPEATSGLTVASNKAIIGSGSSGTIKGKGLRIASGSKNVIVQNIRITTLNPQYVWGGDGISIEGADGVWIDHVTFDNIGRMFIVSHYTANRITTSYNYYNGATSYSNSCDGQQYWGTMFIGEGDKVTIDHNYYYKMSGRSPKLGIKGSDTYFHATNNYFLTSSGHSFDIVSNTYALIEGNAFSSAKTPITTDSTSSGAYIFNSPSSALSACSSYLGRSCIVNSLSSSGTWPSETNTDAVSKLSGSYKSYLITPESASSAMTNVVARAGQGKV